MKPHRLYVGTIGEGLFRSTDSGAAFQRAADGMFVECHVRALAIHPNNDRLLLLGNELGLFRSDDGADSWNQVPSPLDGLQVWSILIHPRNPNLILVGACPSRLFRSDDAGEHWQEVTPGWRRDCPRILWTRVTKLAADPTNDDMLWAGVEIDGIWRSVDRGLNWTRVGEGLSSQDIHALIIPPLVDGKRRLLAATNNDLNASDDGRTWTPLRIGDVMPHSYCRTLASISHEPNTILLGNGDGPPGSTGWVGFSSDGGGSWQRAKMPTAANSTIWNFATHSADPSLIYASSVSGLIFRSTDRGQSWTRLPREFGEIRALAWTP